MRKMSHIDHKTTLNSIANNSLTFAVPELGSDGVGFETRPSGRSIS